jgi:hypothetical protein
MLATTAGSSDSDDVPGASAGACGVVVVPSAWVVVVVGSGGVLVVVDSDVPVHAAATNARTTRIPARNIDDRNGKRFTRSRLPVRR